MRIEQLQEGETIIISHTPGILNPLFNKVLDNLREFAFSLLNLPYTEKFRTF